MSDQQPAGAGDQPEQSDPAEAPTSGSAPPEESAAAAAIPIFRAITESSRRLRDPETTEHFARITREAEERLARLREIQALARHPPSLAAPAAPPPRPARVLLVDDHELAREALRSVLGREPDLFIVGEAGGGREAVAQVRRLQPDLVLMDVRMPDMDGLAATRAIVEASPETRVVLVTSYDTREYVLEVLRNGAAGYVLKGATKQELLATVRAVVSGAVSVHAPGAGEALREAAAGSPPVAHGLSEREIEVLRMLARGATNRAIAVRLHLTVNTVKTHVRHILRKLDAPDRAAAVANAARLGLLGE